MEAKHTFAVAHGYVVTAEDGNVTFNSRVVGTVNPAGAELASILVRQANAAPDLVKALGQLIERHGAYIDALPGETGVSDLVFARAALSRALGKE